MRKIALEIKNFDLLKANTNALKGSLTFCENENSEWKVSMIRELTNVKQNMSVIKFQDNNYLSIEEIDRIISDVATL